MKKFFLLTIFFAAFCLAVLSFRYAAKATNSKAALQLVEEKKKFSIRCAPLYIPSENDDIPLLTGWGNYSWKISTKSDSTQIYFNQGINMYYAFHIIEARASFDKALSFDYNCAMAYWGKALAFGPNINDFGYQRPSEAYASAINAMETMFTASPMEQALINAMSIRYSNDSTADQNKLNMLYRDTMFAVYKKYNKNENVATLFADALMLIHPWDLYNHDFSPKAWTPEIVNVLKHALALNPKHPGANHYFIHAVEASANPADALKSAEFLSTAMPEVSHITHMPSHIYIRTGFYDKGITVNDDGIAGYHKYLVKFPAVKESVSLYALHNIHMKLNCAQMAGNYSIAIEASKSLQQQIPAFYLKAPGALGNYVQYLHQSALFTWVRFGKWEEILKEPIADTLTFTPVMQHFARGMAFANNNKIVEAVKELEAMKIKMADPSLKEVLEPFNNTYDVAMIARNILEGTLAEEKNDFNNAINFYQEAVKEEDHLIYNEPRDWLLPARQYLGNGLLKATRYNEAVAVFKNDLQINPNNGWALTGLASCYQKLKNGIALSLVKKQLKAAWVIKDMPITAAVN